MCSNFSKHQGVVDFCLSATIIPWKGFGLPSSWSQEGGLVILPETNPWIISLWGGRAHKESSSPGNGPGEDQSCALVSLAPISDQLSQAQARSWGLSHLCSYSTLISMDLKLLWKHRNWELQFLTQLCLLAASWTSKKRFICCTPGHHEILPCQALHPYPGFHGKDPGVQARRPLQIFLPESRYQEKANEPDMDPCGASLRSAGLHWDTKSRWRKLSAEPELILSIFWRDYFFVTDIQKLLLIVLESICWTAMLPKLIKNNRKLPCLFQEYWKKIGLRTLFWVRVKKYKN